MAWRKALKYGLLAFVSVSVGTILWQQAGMGSREAEAAAAPAFTASSGVAGAAVKPGGAGENKLLVYYFYTSVRCPTCRRIEALTEETVKTVFAEASSRGQIEWLPTNVQLPQNRHFVRDYELFTKSVVVVLLKDGRQAEWKNLEKVWELVGDKQAFTRYVGGEIRALLRKL
ncbi:MAG: nitrophenyl compound nitroreductase subunit ArsF family protein [Armatimonadota bacterium]